MISTSSSRELLRRALRSAFKEFHSRIVLHLVIMTQTRQESGGLRSMMAWVY